MFSQSKRQIQNRKEVARTVLPALNSAGPEPEFRIQFVFVISEQAKTVLTILTVVMGPLVPWYLFLGMLLGLIVVFLPSKVCCWYPSAAAAAAETRVGSLKSLLLHVLKCPVSQKSFI